VYPSLDLNSVSCCKFQGNIDVLILHFLAVQFVHDCCCLEHGVPYVLSVLLPHSDQVSISVLIRKSRRCFRLNSPALPLIRTISVFSMILSGVPSSISMVTIHRTTRLFHGSLCT
jgi:hypothetical protein